MTARDLVYVLVLLGCGFAVGYQTARDRAQAASPITEEIQATESAPIAIGGAPDRTWPSAAPAESSARLGAAAGPSAPPPVVVVAAPDGPPPETWVTPPELFLPDAAAVPNTIKSRLPNNATSLKGAPVLGDVTTAKILVTVFGDLQCQFTAEGLAALTDAMGRFPGQIALGYRHFPMDHHQWAAGAAVAAWAAGEQGKFWEFARKALSNRDDLGPEALRRIAAELGLDLKRFEVDRSDAPGRWQVEADKVVASTVEVDGTPTVLLNGRRFIGVPDPQVLDGVIRHALEEVNGLIAAGDDMITARGKACERATLRIPLKRRKGGGLDELVQLPIGNSPQRGAKDPLVELVVFSDFQCPPCSKMATALQTVVADDPDVGLSFRQYPLAMHPHARDAALASLFAADFDRFWELHDVMMGAQDRLDRPSLLEHVKAVGLDPQLLDNALRQDTLRVQLESDVLMGSLVGVSSTPAVFVNGRRLPGLPKVDDLKAAVAEAKVQATAVMKAHQFTRKGYYESLMSVVSPN